MIVRTAGDEIVPPSRQSAREGLGVIDHPPRVIGELRRRRLPERHGQRRDLVVVRPPLQHGEDGAIDPLHEAPAREYHPRPRSAQGLVRRARDDVGVRERGRRYPPGHEPGHVRHVDHEERPDGVGDAPHPAVVPLPGVRAPPRDQQVRQERRRAALHVVVVDVPRRRIDDVRHRFEVHGRGADPALRGAEAVGQVPAARQVQSHDAIVRLEEGGVGGEISGRTGVRLDVDTPLVRV